MTDYDKLAQRIVALGVGRGPKDTFRPDMYDLGAYTSRVDAKTFCTDGRVVLALMEKCSHIDAYWDFTGWSCDVVGTSAQRGIGKHDGMVQRSSLAIAICEACCEALEQDDD